MLEWFSAFSLHQNRPGALVRDGPQLQDSAPADLGEARELDFQQAPSGADAAGL